MLSRFVQSDSAVQVFDQAAPIDRPRDSMPCLPDANVVFLVNFVAPNLLDVFRQFAACVKRFTVISSVAIEGNRQWKPETDGLDVIVQRTWTITRTAKHPSGYSEPNYIHVPLDTLSQLRRIRPDAIVSLELGARTMWSQAYRRLNPHAVHIAGILASERSEAGRGGARRTIRRQLLRIVDGATFNGPSCKRYLLALGADERKLSPWDYAADHRKIYSGPLAFQYAVDNHRRLLTVGQLSERKGILQAADGIARFAVANPSQSIDWTIVGSGPLGDALAKMNQPANVKLKMLGHCDTDKLGELYSGHDFLLFPTLADEWGLVANEALASGLPVIGSVHSQAVETLIVDGNNGYSFDPETEAGLPAALKSCFAGTAVEFNAMRANARYSVVDRTAERAADQLVEAIAAAMRRRGRDILASPGAVAP